MGGGHERQRGAEKQCAEPGDDAEASNGERVHLTGNGELGIHPKFGNGGGTFTHTDANGNVVGTGVYNVTDLISFQWYGSIPGTVLSAGRAQLRVELVSQGTNLVFEGLLDVECHLPGVPGPGGTVEGIRLVVPGVANFNRPVGGTTVFLKTS